MSDDDKILFVDDEPSILAALRRHLQKKFDMSTATSGQAALEMIKNDGPFSVIVCDMRMPGMLGTEVLNRVQTLSPDTTRIMLTGNTDQQTAIDAVNEGNVFRFFTKPCEMDALTQGLEAGIRRYQLVTRTKADLMANMNHELRTPLNAIIGFSSMIKDQVLGPIGNETYLEYIDDINRSGEFLLGLINDILDVSDFGSGSLKLNEENADLAEIIASSIRLVGLRAEKGAVLINCTSNPDLPKLCVDIRRTKQTLLNLLENAVKFTPEGGCVSLESRLVEDGSIVLTITDTGIGMNDDEVRIALTRYGQVDSGLDRKLQEGTGLGLPLAKGLMELHGGTLDVQSEKDQGTQITLCFPSERVIADCANSSVS